MRLITVLLFSLCASHAYALTFDAFKALPERTPDSELSTLGEDLFNSPLLSYDQNLSCQSCHQKEHGYSQAVSIEINAPTLLNVTYMDKFFYNGRAKTLKQAIAMHLQEEAVMGMSEEKLIRALEGNELGQGLITQLSAITIDTVSSALEAFLDTLTTPNSKFDQYIQGNVDALNEEQIKGYQLFLSYGCVSCHQGLNIGGNLMQKMGVYQQYNRNPKPTDLGLYQITQKEEDRFVFRVPTLRNIHQSPPYFHDGSANTLQKAIELMGRYQINVDIPQRDIELIEAFLASMDGEEPS